MVTNANMEVDMPSGMQTISPLSLSYSQNCTSKCSKGRRKRRFRQTVDLMSRMVEADEEVGTD